MSVPPHCSIQCSGDITSDVGTKLGPVLLLCFSISNSGVAESRFAWFPPLWKRVKERSSHSGLWTKLHLFWGVSTYIAENYFGRKVHLFSSMYPWVRACLFCALHWVLLSQDLTQHTTLSQAQRHMPRILVLSG